MANLDATVSSRATQTSLDTVDDFLDTEIAAIKAVTDKMDTMLVLDGAVWQLTTNALENATSGGGTDWTTDERTVIRTILGIPVSGTTPADPSSGILDVIRDAVGTKPTLLQMEASTVLAKESTVGSIETKVDTLSSRITATLFSGITSLADWIRRIARKDAGTAGMTTAQSEINTGGTSTFAGTTDSLESIRDNAGGGGGGGTVNITVEDRSITVS
jgi:hypothetical protein